MIRVLATYKNMPEQTAFKMMSNDLLLDRLRTTENDTQFEEQVEIAFVEENKHLLEEKTALEIRLKKEQQQREVETSALEKERQQYKTEQEEAGHALSLVSQELDVVKQALKDHEETAAAALQRANDAEQTAFNLSKSTQEAEKAEKSAFRLSVIAGGLFAILLVTGFEAIVHMAPWTKLAQHQKSLNIQVAISGILVCLAFGGFVKRWRFQVWGVGLIPFIIAVLELL